MATGGGDGWVYVYDVKVSHFSYSLCALYLMVPPLPSKIGEGEGLVVAFRVSETGYLRARLAASRRLESNRCRF